MTNLLRVPRAFLGDVRTAVVHAPLEVLVGLVLAGTFMVLNHGAHTDFEHRFAPMVVVAAIVLPPLFGLSMLRALGRVSPAVRWGASLAVVAAAAAYAWGVFDPDHGAEVWRTAALVGAGILVTALVPAVGRGAGADERMCTWRFWAASVTRIVLVGAYAVVLYATLAGAIGAVGTLFDLHPSGRLYADIAAVIFFALTPCLVVGGIPEIARTTDAGGTTVPRAVRLLGRFLYLPVVLIYGGILYAYTVRVIAIGELPKNLLSPLVIFAALFALAGAVLLEPLRTDDESSATRRVMALAPALLIPLLPLAFRAVWLRQDQYGWTEFRYLRLALLVAVTVLAVAGTVRLVRRRPPLLWMVPAVLAAVLLVSSIGPWSAPAVSRRDQLGRLRAALREAGLLANGRMALPAYRPKHADPVRRVVARDRYDRIQGTVSYLAGEHGPRSMSDVIPQAGTYPDGRSLAQALPIKPGCLESEARTMASALAPAGGLPGLSGGTLYALRMVSARDADTVRTPGVVLGVLDGTALRVYGPGRAWQARTELAPLVARIAGAPRECVTEYPHGMDDDGDTHLQPAEALRPLADPAGAPVGQLVLTRVVVADSVRGGRRFPARLTEADGWVVVRE
ncbi:MAG TPA: DUF4153 domain-containing protein [Longimicrobiaceae bacterium]|nr:DUF4153 domain-containing protein [Longimicrobiaceae bacterium]